MMSRVKVYRTSSNEINSETDMITLRLLGCSGGIGGTGRRTTCYGLDDTVLIDAGTGAGEGCNLNYPMPPNTPYGPWAEALDHAIARIRAWGAEALVVSLGVDAYKDDPISFFRLDSPDFTDCGQRIGRMGLPTVFCMEGGYAIAQVGVNTVNVLEGFQNS